MKEVKVLAEFRCFKEGELEGTIVEAMYCHIDQADREAGNKSVIIAESGDVKVLRIKQLLKGQSGKTVEELGPYGPGTGAWCDIEVGSEGIVGIERAQYVMEGDFNSDSFLQFYKAGIYFWVRKGAIRFTKIADHSV